MQALKSDSEMPIASAVSIEDEATEEEAETSYLTARQKKIESKFKKK